MIITCPNCSTKYSVDPSALGATGKAVRCSNCGNTWVQPRIEEPPRQPVYAPPPPPAYPQPQPGFYGQQPGPNPYGAQPPYPGFGPGGQPPYPPQPGAYGQPPQPGADGVYPGQAPGYPDQPPAPAPDADAYQAPEPASDIFDDDDDDDFPIDDLSADDFKVPTSEEEEEAAKSLPDIDSFFDSDAPDDEASDDLVEDEAEDLDDEDVMDDDEFAEAFDEADDPEGVGSLMDGENLDDDGDIIDDLDDLDDPEPIPQVFMEPRDQGAQKKGKGGLIVAILLLLLIGGGAGGLVLGKAQIIAVYPPAADYYEMIGMGGEDFTAGLRIRNEKAEWDQDSGNLKVSGLVSNVSEQVRQVPLIRIVFSDADGKEVQSTVVEPDTMELPPLENMPFEATIENPDGRARKMDIVLIQRPEEQP